jgi:hypothetical protein
VCREVASAVSARSSSRLGSHFKTASAARQLQPADLGAVCPAPGHADGSALPYRGIRGDRQRPHEILYDRIVIGEAGGGIVYSRALIDFARHYGFQPKACRPYRAKTKGKVERPYRYIREDFFLACSFRYLGDLNVQLRHWLDTVANPRVHATTRCVVNEAFTAENSHLGALPLASFRAVLELERRVSHEGMVSVGGNLYSVPDATRKRIVEVHTLANEVQIFEEGTLIAIHPVLDGRAGSGGLRRAIARCHALPVVNGARNLLRSGAAKFPSLAGWRSAVYSAPPFSVVGPGVSARRNGVRGGLRFVADCLGDEIGVLA